MKFWLANTPGQVEEAGMEREELENVADGGKTTHHLKISSEYVDKLIRQAEWVEVDAARTEIYLGLCWGDPLEYRYQWAKPKSGCDRVIASPTIPSSIKI